MRLLKWNSQNAISLTEDLVENVPPYAILSHTWSLDRDEVTFADVEKGLGQSKAGYEKIQFCGEQARRDGIEHFWVDTCCINKADLTELSEAIASMFRWYRNAVKCYVYLSDVSSRKCGSDGSAQNMWEPSLQSSRWFTRGWTLQELLAPLVVEFYSREKEYLGDKTTLLHQIHKITTIPFAALKGDPLSQFPISERMRWTENRKTKKQEDQAYCLQGIFNVFIPLIYGERENAFCRLRKAINDQFGSDVAAGLGEVNDIGSLGLCWGSAPLMDANDFIGRAIELDQMAQVLRPGEPAVEQRRLLLGGMGGIGKTQMAIAFARRYSDSYTTVFWLNATSEKTLKASFQSVGKLLLPAVALKDLDEEGMVQAVLRWLSDIRNPRWLLIFDNYDDPSLYAIGDYLPNTANGSILVTSRVPDLLKFQRMPQIRVWPIQSLEESLQILRTRSQREITKYDPDARFLAERLAGLPLALATAGAYLRKTTMTFRQYLEIYNQRFNVNRQRPTQLEEYQDRTLYSTWDLSYQQLEKDSDSAAKMLKLLAYFDNQAIWHELLRAGLCCDSSKWLEEVVAELIDFENTMSVLVDYCFVDTHPTTGSYSVHNCVHDWTLAQLNETINQDYYEYAINCIAANINQVDCSNLARLEYAPLARHASRLSHNQLIRGVQLDTMPLICFNQMDLLAFLLTEQSQLSTAETTNLQVLSGKEKTLGYHHPSTLGTVNNLGYLYYSQGKLDVSEKMFERALTGHEEALEPDLASTCIIISNLGLVYRDQGRLNLAEQMLSRALAGFEKAFGPHHFSTLNTINNLGLVYYDQDKLDLAQQMFLKALAGYEKTVRSYDMSTLDAVHHLGNLYYSQDKLDEAEQMLQRARAGRERAVGPNHPLTLTTIKSLGRLYRKQNKLAEAERVFLRVLGATEKLKGLDDILNLESKFELACLYHSQKKTSHAEAMYRQVLVGCETRLGNDSIQTLTVVYDLGLLYWQQDRFDEAELMFQRAVVGYRKQLGQNHRKTLRVMQKLDELNEIIQTRNSRYTDR